MGEEIFRREKEIIINKSSQMFVEQGIDNVTMGDIAKASGIGEATLYRRFGSKDNLVIEAGTYIWKYHLDKYFLEKNNDCPNANGYELVANFFKGFYYVYKNETQYLSFIIEFDNYVARHGINQDELSAYDEQLAKNKEAFDAVFKKGCQDGSIRRGIDRDVFYYTATRSLLALIGKLSQGAMLKSDTTTKPLYQIEMLIDLICRYIDNNR